MPRRARFRGAGRSLAPARTPSAAYARSVRPQVGDLVRFKIQRGRSQGKLSNVLEAAAWSVVAEPQETHLYSSTLPPENPIQSVGGSGFRDNLEPPLTSRDEISSQALGLRVRRDEAGSNTEVGRAHVEATKGANGGPPHIHLHQEERFIVHTGVLLVRRRRERLHVGAGGDVRIPPRCVHTWRAEADSTFTVEFRPPLRIGEFFRDLFALPTDRRGNPRVGDFARLMRAYPDECLYFPYVPIPIQRALAVLLSKLGSPPH